MTDHILSTDVAFNAANNISFDPMVAGGKGAGLMEMSHMGLNVPAAIIITTEEWAHYRLTGELQPVTKKSIFNFAKGHASSMFSVRSGAPVSMPGMMDTVLNVGCTAGHDEKFPGANRRFVIGWLETVKGASKSTVKSLMQRVDGRAIDGAHHIELLNSILGEAHELSIPVERHEQLYACVTAVFDSWFTVRAKAYRAMHEISEDMGTACVIQRMVMGTSKGLSGSGVMFTRDPSTGENILTGEIAFNAQGEEVVSGEITPEPISFDKTTEGSSQMTSVLFDELRNVAAQLEIHYTHVQDIEFTVQDGELFILQTRNAKMSARAAIVTACALAQTMQKEDRLTYLKQYVKRSMIAKTMTPTVKADAVPILTGLAASPGAIAGKIVFRHTPLSQINKSCILVCEDTSPDDFPRMAASGAILTATGGFTCHSAVVARGIGVPAVVGCEGVSFGGCSPQEVSLNHMVFTLGDSITLDGSEGHVHEGALEVTKSQPPRVLYETLNAILKEANHDLPKDAFTLECAVGDRVSLALDPGDLDRCEVQIERAHRLIAKGKEVGFILSVPGFSQDLIINTIASVFGPLYENYGADMAGLVVLGGLDTHAREQVCSKFHMQNHQSQVSVIDLLDLLD